MYNIKILKDFYFGCGIINFSYKLNNFIFPSLFLDMSKRSNKSSNIDSENIKRLKKYIVSRDPETVQRRIKYSNSPVVKERRRVLNKDRRLMNSILIKMIEEGHFYDSSGKKYSINRNRCIIPDDKVYFSLGPHKEIIKTHYPDEFTLLEMPYNPPSHSKNNAEFQLLLKRFVDGDPEVMNLVSKKRVVSEQSDPNIENMRSVIKNILENSESDSDE